MAEKTKFQRLVGGADSLSLGISIVVAVLMGVGVGIFLKHTFDYTPLLFLGIFWGVAAAFLNIYKAYKKHQKEFKEFEEQEQNVQKAIENNENRADKTLSSDER